MQVATCLWALGAFPGLYIFNPLCALGEGTSEFRFSGVSWVSKLCSLDPRDGTNSILSRLYHTSTDRPRFQGPLGIDLSRSEQNFHNSRMFKLEAKEGEFGWHQVYRS